MTRHAHLKDRVRARMAKTGERYAARRHVLAQRAASLEQPPADPSARPHFPGNVPATTALRVLLDHAGVRVPASGQPISEALLFGLGITPIVQEAGGAKAAEARLRAALAEHGPCIAWVDSSALAHRATPAALSGSGYHVVTVYELDEAGGTALIGDLADEPVAITLASLAQTRSRIKKDRHLVLLTTKARPTGGASPVPR